MPHIQTYGVPVTGIGLADYSLSVESSVQPMARSVAHQARVSSAFNTSDFGIGQFPTLTYPDVYWWLAVDFTKNGTLVYETALDLSTYLMQISVGGDTNATSVVVWAATDAYDIYFNPVPPIEMLAIKYAPKTAQIRINKGMLRERKYYWIGTAHYSVNPGADLLVTLEFIQDELIGADTTRFYL